MTNSPAQILVADSNPAHIQKISAELTAMGCRFCTAANGCEVLTLLLRHQFDAVLLELDLPTISGLDAAHAIRASEQGSGKRMLVIGMAREGASLDPLLLLESGLDGILHQPFAGAELRHALQPVSPAVNPAAVAGTGASAALEAQPALPAECLDGEKVSEFLGTDPSLYAEMVDLLLQEFPKRMAQMRAAIEQHDGKTLERGAHSLKGALSYFCSKPVIQRLQKLETAGRELDFATATPQHHDLEAFFPRLKQALQARLAPGPAASATASMA